MLGGGGVAGIAWEIGIVYGLARAGVALQEAELFVGTSAGSVVGAQLASRVPIERLYRQQVEPLAGSLEQIRSYSQAAADAENRKLFDKVGGDLPAARRRIGAFALRSATVAPETRRAIVASRLPATEWPAAALKIVAVNAESGIERVFDSACGFALVDAVTARCAVPGSWPTVEIDGMRCMDGGIRSMTNADLATGCARAEVVVIEPDPGSLEEMDENVLDPARASASAAAGAAQGRQLGASVAAAWALSRSCPAPHRLSLPSGAPRQTCESATPTSEAPPHVTDAIPRPSAV